MPLHITRLAAAIINVPLRKAFRHASATRSISENVIVSCTLSDGTTGWGEGVPRSYVTGETPEGAIEQFGRLSLDQIASDISDWSGVIEMLDTLQLPIDGAAPRGCDGNALRCAIELSILDAFGRGFGEPVCNLIDHLDEAAEIRKPVGPVRYSTTIDSEKKSKLWLSAFKMRAFGFQHCKIKVGGGTLAEDRERIGILRRWLGGAMQLRVDANESWTPQECEDRIRCLQTLGVECFEQPVAHEEIGCLAAVRENTGGQIMLDESLTSMHDARAAIDMKAVDVFNIRLSKCGGFLASVRLAALAQNHGLQYQLGCHPGETAILSAAGRQWAQRIRGIKYLEGSYDRFLLRENVTEMDLTFRYGGRAKAMLAPGLGVEIVDGLVQSMVETWCIHTL